MLCIKGQQLEFGLRLEEGRTINSVITEYGISKESVRRWRNEFQKKCQAQSLQTPSSINEAEIMKDSLRLRRELDEKDKEILFLKNSGILRKGNRLEAYRFIEWHNREFGIRWLLKRLGVCPNAYYNCRKRRKADYYARKEAAKTLISEIYHTHNGVAGYRAMTVYLARRGCHYSAVTVHKYMNTKMRLYSLACPKKPGYRRGKPHKIFDDKLQRELQADRTNHKRRRISHICF